MKSYVVTGSNKGIGLAIAKSILDEIYDSFVFICSRSLERGQAAAQSLFVKDASYLPRIAVIQLDLSSPTSRNNAAAEVREFLNENKEKAPLEGLVNNAGIGGEEFSFQEMLDVNVFGVKEFTDLMIPIMSEAGRIVNIGSSSAPNYIDTYCNTYGVNFFKDPNITWQDILDAVEGFTNDMSSKNVSYMERFGLSLETFSGYVISKALVHCLTMIQAREYPLLRINACNPGYIITDMTLKRAHGDMEKAKSWGAKTPAEGTKSTLYLLKTTSLRRNGLYYGEDCRRSPLHVHRSADTPEYDSADSNEK